MKKQDEKILVIEDMSKSNKWVADLAQTISDACSENQRGFVFIPFSHAKNLTENDSPKSCLMTDLDPTEFMAAMASGIANYCRFRKDIYSKMGAGLTFMDGSEMAKYILDCVKDMEEDQDGNE